MWKGPDLVMRAAVTIMGERLDIERGSLYFEGRGIFEVASNPDETIGDMDIENFKSIADFRKTDIATDPRPGDVVIVVGTGRRFIIDFVKDDYFGRYRCYLKDE